MYITFNDKKIKKICEDQKTAIRKLGKQMTDKLYQRIGEIRASENLSILRLLPSPRCHPLTGDRSGQYAIDLTNPKRLILTPVFEGETKDETAVTEVVIHEIIDYH